MSHTYTESEIDAARRELLKRLQLYRITSLLNSLPATAPRQPSACVTPGAVVAGNLSMEQQA